MIYELPQALEIDGTAWDIRTDYRVVLTILEAFDDPNLEDQHKLYVCLYNLYEDFEHMPQDIYNKAYSAAVKFIDAGRDHDDRPTGPKTLDWVQDAPLLFPAVNRVAGMEIRSVEYLHWWTFMGYFMEIHDGTFAQVLQLRGKKAKGKKLEKYEREYWAENKDICQLKTKLTDEELAEKEKLKALLG